MNVRNDAEIIINSAIAAVMPEKAVQKVLEGRVFGGRVVMVAIGKAAYAMAAAAAASLGGRLSSGIAITKYFHAGEDIIPNTEVYCAGHPIPDEKGIEATSRAIELVQGLSKDDTVVFLISGGGSALFELPVVPLEELSDINAQLLKRGADIGEINTIRKRLSKVKGGRFAELCQPAKVLSIVLSDVLGDRLDVIASGPAAADTSTTSQAMEIAEKYKLEISKTAWEALQSESPKALDNVETHITGSVSELCAAATEASRDLGYEIITLSHSLDCEAREAGSFLGSVAKHYHGIGGKYAIISGGETIVHVTGNGKGGRNQELALSAARQIEGLDGVVVASAGSDGTDGPTDAAGGIVDGETVSKLASLGINIHSVLLQNDSYSALKAAGSLLITGPTGTNVNDLYMALVNN